MNSKVLGELTLTSRVPPGILNATDSSVGFCADMYKSPSYHCSVIICSDEMTAQFFFGYNSAETKKKWKIIS